MSDGAHLRIVGRRVIDVLPQPRPDRLELGGQLVRLHRAAVLAFVHPAQPLHAELRRHHQAELLAEPKHEIVDLGIDRGESHVIPGVSRLRQVLLRHRELRPELPFDLVDLPGALLDAGLRHRARSRLHERKEVAVGIDDRRRGGQRPPLHVRPLARERQVHADVEAGILFEQPRRLEKPRPRHDDVGGGEHAALVGVDGPEVDAVRRAHVVAFDDQADLGGSGLQGDDGDEESDGGAHGAGL